MRIGYLMECGVPDVRRPDASGAAQHVWQTIRGLQQLGHDVCLVARLDDEIVTSTDLVTFRRVDGVNGRTSIAERAVRRLQANLNLPYFSFFDSRRFGVACVRELGECDLLYERMGWMGLGGGQAARRLGVPHVLEVNGDLLRELALNGCQPIGLQRWASLMRMGQMTRGVTHAVATGAGWRSRHIEQWGIEPAKVSVIQNGTALVELLSREQLRAFAPERDACLRVAYVGSFDPWQGLPTLLRAVSSVVASGASIELRIAGAGREEATLRSMTHQLGLERRVRFLGHLPVIDLGRCLCDCDVGVSLYHGRAEFTGLKLLDYKAAGLATVAVGDGGQPDVIEHGKTGVIVPPDDEQAVVSALLALSRDRAWQGQLGREARRSAEARHSWRHTVQALDNLFQRLLRPDLAQGERIADATPVGG